MIIPTLPRGNASRDALRHRCARLKSGRGASQAASTVALIHTDPTVGAGLPAMTDSQLALQCLTHRNRRQASSHS